jgi:hypothetical protein
MARSTPECAPSLWRQSRLNSSPQFGPLQIFFALQAADLVTTLIFRSIGIAETNPLAGFLMEHFGTLVGLLLLKSAAICIAWVSGVAAHSNFMRKINIFYCVIVAVNYLTICNSFRR